MIHLITSNKPVKKHKLLRDTYTERSLMILLDPYPPIN